MIRSILQQVIKGLSMSVPPTLTPNVDEVTMLLRECMDGDAEGRARLFSVMYPELKRIAEGRMRRRR